MILLALARNETAQAPWYVYVDQVDRRTSLFRVRPDGSQRGEVLALDFGHMPAIRPAGGMIAFVQTDLWLMEDSLMLLRGDGQRLQTIFTANAILRPQWSPDGQSILFSARAIHNHDPFQIYRYDLADERLSRINPSDTDSAISNYDAVWSPDGSQIAYTTEQNFGRKVFIMGADGSNPQALITGSGDSWRPLWTKEGQSLIFLSNRDIDMEIYRLNLSDGLISPLGQRPTYTWYHRLPSGWLEDDRLILDVFRNGSWGVYTMDMSDGQTRPIPVLPQQANVSAQLSIWPVADLPFRFGLCLVGLGISLVLLLKFFHPAWRQAA